ncbi:MAG: GAF domain-containing protein [Hoeflea sp.]|uniref:helix-turn-helix domain-containing protein n=1 Tax=Hoeflea sp. TaxID=1940281 RepID=UPI002730BDC1|nr:helix-turn-helix domain-containing protein [Hoeflea sp.]MDP2119036.1 GAF domain-containing protein [Hoeflea sp.]MDP3527362.1 GAF domain-containing protein [Hoeflea sp.]
MDPLTAVLDILQKINRDADEMEIASAVDRLAALAPPAMPSDEVSLLQSTIKQISQSRRETALSENGLSLLIETTHDLSKTLELPSLFRTIVSRARSLVGANLAWVTILDEDSGLFRSVASEGYLSPSAAVMTSNFEYGAVSLIMQTKSFFDTQDYLNDTRFKHLPELDRAFRIENIVSLAGFPIMADGEVHGFLFVADRYARKLSGRNMSVLGSFALHAGVAMRNANAFRLLSEALAEAQHNRNALIEHIQRVEASAAVHDEMTSLLAAGGEMQKFLQRMANQIGGAIFLFDDELRIRDEYVASAYRGRFASDLKSGAFETTPLISSTSQSRHTGRSVVMHIAAEEQCRVIALHGWIGSGECLVVCHQGELDAIEIRNLERSAVALSIAKLWNEKRETEKLIASSTLLRHLVRVTPADPSTVSAVRDRLGLSSDEPVMLVLIAVPRLDGVSQSAVIQDCASRTNVLVDLLDDAYVGLGSEGALRAFLQKLMKIGKGWSPGGILSDPFTDLTLASSRYGQLGKALQVMMKMKPLDHFIAQSEIDFFARIFETGDPASLARYMEQMLHPIDARAPRQAAELKKTLLCYLEGQYNIKRAADILGVHINTVRQRLDTLRQITGGWDDPVRALELHIALRLAQILETGPKETAEPGY